MEVLSCLRQSQEDLEDTLRIEINYEDVWHTKDGKRLLKWIRRRRKSVERFIRLFC